ncbi:MAG: hypothetical protein QXR58_00480 [Candidatus Micrarchaeaceae archaeon]
MHFKATLIGFEALVALLIALTIFAAFFIRFNLAYSGAANYLVSIYNETASDVELQRIFYLSYYSNLSIQNFTSLLNAQPAHYSIIPFQNSASAVYPARIIAIGKKVYLVSK